LPLLPFKVIFICEAGDNANVFGAWHLGVWMAIVINRVSSFDHFGTKLVNFLGKCANGDFLASRVYRN
jgi:hypothetical protein